MQKQIVTLFRSNSLGIKITSLKKMDPRDKLSARKMGQISQYSDWVEEYFQRRRLNISISLVLVSQS